MSGATAHRAPNNITAFFERLGGEMGVYCDLGHAEDARLKQPDRVDVKPVKDSGRLRECTALYTDGVVYTERSNAFDVILRGNNESAAKILEEKFLNALVTLGATPPGVEIETGNIDPFSVAAEQGWLISWQIRIWEPVYYSRFVQGHIETTETPVNVRDQFDQEAGSIP